MKNFIVALLVGIFVWTGHAEAQTLTPGLPVIPMGDCQLSATQLGSAIGLSKCTRASFTASAGASSNLLVVTSVTGVILVNDTLLTGTGITAGGTIVSQVSGTPGGAGTYTISNTNTTSSATVTTGGIPMDAQGHSPNMAVLSVETAAVRYRDDGGAPTTTIGVELPSGVAPFTYAGTMTALQLIGASGSPVVDLAFYRTSSP